MSQNRTLAGAPLPPVSPDELPLAKMYRWERERPDDVYLVQPTGRGAVREYTFADTMGEARRLATFLRAKEYAPGTRIALLSKNCAQHVIFDLAIWLAGHVSVSIYPTVAADTLRYILEHAEIPLLFVGKLDAWEPLAAGVPDEVQLLSCELSPPVPTAERWEGQLPLNEPLADSPRPAPNDAATVMYTSGSTGTPKGVMHDFAGIIAPGRSTMREFEVTPDDRVLSYLPYAHSFERACIEIPSMMHGYRMYFAESLDTFLDDLQRARPTVFQSVPRLWLKFKAGVDGKLPPAKLARMLRMPLVGRLVKKKILRGLGLDAARFAFTGSAPIPLEVLKWYRELGLELVEGYGMTENATACTANFIGRSRPGTVGEPSPGVELRIADDGELQVKSPGMMTGYLKDPERTAEAFTSDGWLRTGDRAERVGDRHVKITGRVKEIFKTSKGKYIAPAPIENVLNSTDLIEQSCVMGIGLPQPFAVVMLNDDARVRLQNGGRADVLQTLERVVDEANAGLEHHERLQQLVVTADAWQIENGLLTPSMKIKRAAIEERYASFADEASLRQGRVRLEA